MCAYAANPLLCVRVCAYAADRTVCVCAYAADPLLCVRVHASESKHTLLFLSYFNGCVCSALTYGFFLALQMVIF